MLDRIVRSLSTRRVLIGLLAALPPSLALGKERPAAKRKHTHGRHHAKANRGTRHNGKERHDGQKKRHHTRSKGARGPRAGASVLPGDAVLLARYDGFAINPKVRYRPRQWVNGAIIPDASWGNWTLTNAGAYSGWDYLPLANDGSSRASTLAVFAKYTLNRLATVGMVWRGGTPLPAWIAAQGWIAAGTITASNPSRGTQTYPVYKKAQPAGEFTIGGPNNPGDSTVRNLMWMLFAEANGSPSAAPSVPAGRATPTPNQTCPAWVHDQYVTIGPDGQGYPTWHPVIDPVYWCYFRHDHGSDPKHVFPDGSFLPPYHYVATLVGMTENHWGHKSHALKNADNYWIYITQHVGTTGVARANTCLQRFHLVELIVRNEARDETLAHLQLMGDYGRSLVSTATGNTEYTPSACPTGNHDTGITTSVPVRKIPIAGAAIRGYEPWQFAQSGYEGMGLSGAMTINTQSPLDICNAIVCDTPSPNPTFSGLSRILQPINLRITDPHVSADGHFCTDGMGAVVACGASAVPQYVKPGLDLAVRGTGSTTQTHFETGDWGDVLYVSAGGALDRDIDGSIVETHGPN